MFCVFCVFCCLFVCVCVCGFVLGVFGERYFVYLFFVGVLWGGGFGEIVVFGCLFLLFFNYLFYFYLFYLLFLAFLFCF